MHKCPLLSQSNASCLVEAELKFSQSQREIVGPKAQMCLHQFSFMAGNRLSPKSKFPSSLCFKFEWKTMGPTAKKQNKKKTTRPFSECSTDQTKMDKKSKSTRLSLFSSWMLFEWEKSLRMRKSINSLSWNLFFLNAIVEKRSPQMRTSLLIVEKYQQKLINKRKHFITQEKSFQTQASNFGFRQSLNRVVLCWYRRDIIVNLF